MQTLKITDRPELRSSRLRRSKVAAIVIRLHQAGFTNDFFMVINGVMMCAQDGTQYPVHELRIRNIEIPADHNQSKIKIIYLIETPEGVKGLHLADRPLMWTNHKFNQTEPNILIDKICLSPVQSAFLCKKLEAALLHVFTRQRINKYIQNLKKEGEDFEAMANTTNACQITLRLATANWDAMYQQDRTYIISSFLRLFKGTAAVSDYGKACQVFCNLFLNDFTDILKDSKVVYR
jgi:hypothetical protein